MRTATVPRSAIAARKTAADKLIALLPVLRWLPVALIASSAPWHASGILRQERLRK
jgi:hypothetical protein